MAHNARSSSLMARIAFGMRDRAEVCSCRPDDTVGRHIDDVPTTAQTFNVAGFGKVCDWSACPPCLRLPSPLGRGCASSRPGLHIKYIIQ